MACVLSVLPKPGSRTLLEDAGSKWIELAGIE
jgi:hypothetical protein